ncbi:MAG: hypothetical protein HKO59_18020 [Phycisphaerales bacterium]|nr:type II secretion system protein GspG [Phycisphaerae bacterium]NNF44678.1 hypothetical protein [Phycisphaerales bacterium]NNM27836.1 hypothetical protein [Phycisphaerales bacterium]
MILPRRRLLQISGALTAFCGVCVIGSNAFGIDIAKLKKSTATTPVDVMPPVAVSTTPPSFLRVSGDDGNVVALEIASRRYVRPAGGPVLNLVGVVHIGEGAYYRAVQDELIDADVVLYESVKPEGTGGPPASGEESDETRIDRTEAGLRFVAGYAERYHRRQGVYPPDLDTLQRMVGDEGARERDFLEIALLDAWGRPVRYEGTPGDETSPSQFRLISLGADGAPGGDGPDADRVVDAGDRVPPHRNDRADNMQVQLASALKLDFQLDAIDYDQPGWRCSDLSIDQVRRAMAERGSDFTIMENAIGGTALPAQIARFFLGLVRMADAFMEGAVSDTIKILLVEMLGDERTVDASLQAFDPAFAEVIIGARNQAVVDDLTRLLHAEPEVEEVAVLYGAGHMADLSRRLAALGYVPSEDVTWRRPIVVDLDRSAVSAEEVAYLRRMVRQMMRNM